MEPFNFNLQINYIGSKSLRLVFKSCTWKQFETKNSQHVLESKGKENFCSLSQQNLWNGLHAPTSRAGYLWFFIYREFGLKVVSLIYRAILNYSNNLIYFQAKITGEKNCKCPAKGIGSIETDVHKVNFQHYTGWGKSRQKYKFVSSLNITSTVYSFAVSLRKH